ncbi:relaxase/mobilization nuclease domain-containing protein [sulfur-oxidizing endosymbiont of Gigantopelta aegis]|uniref:relaxase/mobilization nuclease domain-containing protein n=1 Tax=sulfur-oxidizing endosymbiont of Gigantopelta aegis TaxID=2794934 RepID=UPI0018DE941C|nr:relaxase/mobilization nuclease domain-containing protein [sulfur-oxidizing endosymbiont of Gigantopelta aegis]
MADYESSLHGFLEEPVKYRGKVKIDPGRRVTSRGKRVIRRSPEVMVKITGNTKGVSHTGSHLDYISRNGDLKLENERGEVIEGKEAMKELKEEWAVGQGRGRKNKRLTTNIILSMPKGTNTKGLVKAARGFASKTFGDNYQYVFVLHEDSEGENPHVHLTVRNLGFDGKRLHIKKGDPQIWRETFATELRWYGIDAEATPRAVRGVVKKGVSQVIKHIRKSGRTAQVDKDKVDEIIKEFAKKEQKEKPWEEKIINRQNVIRKLWLGTAQKLLKSKSQEDQELGNEIVDYVNTMPPLKTERHEMMEKMLDMTIKQEKEMQAKGNENGQER